MHITKKPSSLEKTSLFFFCMQQEEGVLELIHSTKLNIPFTQMEMSRKEAGTYYAKFSDISITKYNNLSYPNNSNKLKSSS